MMQPLLTIAVPTYERPQFLDQLLGSVAAEIERDPTLEGDIEVVVSDNASGPSTGEVVRQWQARHPGVIQYRRNPQNVGGPRNLLAAFEAASGRYVLFIGDDDRLRRGACDTIREVLKAYAYPPVCVFAPEWYLSGEFKSLPPDFDALLRLESAFRGYFACAGIPAGSAIRTDLAKAAIARAGTDQLLRTNWPQTAVAFIAAAMSGVPAPVAARHTEIAHISEHHDQNILYDAWTVWHTGVNGKVLAAQVVQDVTGEACLRPACADIFAPKRMNKFFEKSRWHLLGIDAEDDVARFTERMESSLEIVPPEFHAAPRNLIALARLPRGRRLPRMAREIMLGNEIMLGDFAAVLRKPSLLFRRWHALRHQLLAVYRYRRSHRRKERSYARGTEKHIRNYAREGY